MLYSVRDHEVLPTGHKTRFWCCQDRARKKKTKKAKRPDAKCRDTEGMCRFDCSSRMSITCRRGSTPALRLVTLSIDHHARHTKYYDVRTPPEVTALIRENIEYSTPNEIARRVRLQYPHVTAAQVHYIWSEMSQESWKRDDVQLISAQKLLKELSESGDVEVFDVKIADGVEIV